MTSSYDSAASYLLARTSRKATVGIICGSGLSGLAQALSNTITIPYNEIPGFPEVTVAGHRGEIVFGTIGEVSCVCLRGRFHFYEGHSMETVALPVRVLRLLGVKLLVVTNAAGGINPQYSVGDIMVIQDHFGLPCVAGWNPLRGHNDDRLGTRFPAMSDVYCEQLQRLTMDVAEGLQLHHLVRADGTYCYVSGPQYESKAECRFLLSIGGDAVGMSTVPEIIAARHCGMRVLGLSLITNKVVLGKSGAASGTGHASHKEVLAAVETSGQHVERIVRTLIGTDAFIEYLHALPDADVPIFTTTTTATTGTGADKGNKTDKLPASPPPLPSSSYSAGFAAVGVALLLSLAIVVLKQHHH